MCYFVARVGNELTLGCRVSYLRQPLRDEWGLRELNPSIPPYKSGAKNRLASHSTRVLHFVADQGFEPRTQAYEACKLPLLQSATLTTI